MTRERPHDVGGMQGFGPIVPEPKSRSSTPSGIAGRWRLRSPWARRASGSIDRVRHARESLAPRGMICVSYYEGGSRRSTAVGLSAARDAETKCARAGQIPTQRG